MIRRVVAAALVLSIGSGCYRTLYRNLQPVNAPPVVEDASAVHPRLRSSWQSFFMYGWFPLDRNIDANRQCGEGHVKAVETQQSFAQGTTAWAVMVLFYLGIYSPWDAAVSCDHPATR